MLPVLTCKIYSFCQTAICVNGTKNIYAERAMNASAIYLHKICLKNVKFFSTFCGNFSKATGMMPYLYY